MLESFEDISYEIIEGFVHFLLANVKSPSTRSVSVASLKHHIKHGQMFEWDGFPSFEIFDGTEQRTLQTEDTLKSMLIDDVIIDSIDSSLRKWKTTIKPVLENLNEVVLWVNDTTVSKDSNSIFNIQSGEQFSPSLEILNGFDSQQKYRIIFLIDYQQPIKFNVNGKEHTYIDLDINADSTKTIDITFPDLKVGQHDLTTIIIREPDRVLKEPNFIPGFEHILAHRSNIIVSTKD